MATRRAAAIITGEGKRVRLVMGAAYRSALAGRLPAREACSRVVLAPSAVLPLDPDYDERAIDIASGEIDIAGDHVH